jgi:hypothetical protein
MLPYLRDSFFKNADRKVTLRPERLWQAPERTFAATNAYSGSKDSPDDTAGGFCGLPSPTRFFTVLRLSVESFTSEKHASV